MHEFSWFPKWFPKYFSFLDFYSENYQFFCVTYLRACKCYNMCGNRSYNISYYVSGYIISALSSCSSSYMYLYLLVWILSASLATFVLMAIAIARQYFAWWVRNRPRRRAVQPMLGACSAPPRQQRSNDGVSIIPEGSQNDTYQSIDDW